MKTIIRHSRFVSNPFGDGGAKRSAQIEELLEKAGVGYSNVEFVLPQVGAFSQRIRWLILGFRFVACHFSLKEIRSLSNGMKMAKYFGLRIPLFEKYANKDVLFLNEDTTSGSYGYPYLARNIGKKMIAVPHNIESLCYTGADLQSGKPALGWFYEDIERLKSCDAVFCISKEETWLLQIYGINVHYLPYYPPKAAEEYLLNIREKRQERIPNRIPRFLVLGSAENLPTRFGMIEVLEFLGSHEKLPFEVHVAGYKTEELKRVAHPRIVYHGTLSKRALEQQLMETDALVINQAATSGALTRIVEHLIAGIPVMASFGAARDYFYSKDVHVFYSMDELMEMMVAFKPREVMMPERNILAEEGFVKLIQKELKC